MCSIASPKAPVARAAIERGYISFSGIVSFKNAQDLRDLARHCRPIASLIETDSPYLAPVPFRGQAEHPGPGAARGQGSGRGAGRQRRRTGGADHGQHEKALSSCRPREGTEHAAVAPLPGRGPAGLGATGAQAAPIDDLVLAAEFNDPRSIARLLTRGSTPICLTDGAALRSLPRCAKGPARPWAPGLTAAGPNLANASGETPLMLAAIRGNLVAARALVKSGAAVNRPGWSPLHYAASGPDGGVTAFLLTQGAEVNARSPNGTTPLMMSARYGSSGSRPSC